MQVCIGTESGSLGSLDIASHEYSTLLRSHSDSVNCVAVDAAGLHCVTASSDGTVRVWDLASFKQLCAPAPGAMIFSFFRFPSF